MLNFQSMAKPGDSDNFEIDDRSSKNDQRAINELKNEYGSGYQTALKNAKAVLKWADGDYSKQLEKTGLGNYAPLIKELNKLGHELEKEYKQADKPGTMRKAMLKAFHSNTREKVNRIIFKFESEYATKHGGISR